MGVDRGTSSWEVTEPVTSSLPSPPISLFCFCQFTHRPTFLIFSLVSFDANTFRRPLGASRVLSGGSQLPSSPSRL